MSLRLRLALSFGVVVALGIGVASLAAYVSTERALQSEIDDFLDVRAKEINEGIRPQPLVGGPDTNPQRRRRGGDTPTPQPSATDNSGDVNRFIDIFAFDPDAVIQAIDASGRVLGSQGGSLPVANGDLALAAQPGENWLRDVDIDGVEYRILTSHLDGGGAVQVARELTEITTVLSTLGRSLAGIGLILSLVAAIVGWVVARRTTQPLRRLTEAAATIASTQDLATPIPAGGSDEVGLLADSLDTMIEALATSQEQQQRLVMDASHELRTPLTSIRTNVELLDRIGALEPGRRREITDAVVNEIEELAALVTELVELATDSRDDLAMEPVALASIVDECVERLNRRTSRPVEVRCDASLVLGSAPMLERAIGNLLANADKFAPPGTPVDVSVFDGRVRVRDHGPGFVEADLPHVFQRFYRSVQTRSMPGSGLGLAIVAQVVHRHRGEVVAANAVDGGAIVGFDLPTAEPEG